MRPSLPSPLSWMRGMRVARRIRSGIIGRPSSARDDFELEPVLARAASREGQGMA
jgi:hypothetical protein